MVIDAEDPLQIGIGVGIRMTGCVYELTNLCKNPRMVWIQYSHHKKLSKLSRGFCLVVQGMDYGSCATASLRQSRDVLCYNYLPYSTFPVGLSYLCLLMREPISLDHV